MLYIIHLVNKLSACFIYPVTFNLFSRCSFNLKDRPDHRENNQCSAIKITVSSYYLKWAFRELIFRSFLLQNSLKIDLLKITNSALPVCGVMRSVSQSGIFYI